MSSTEPSGLSSAWETLKTVVALPINIMLNHPDTPASLPTYRPSVCPERIALHETVMSMSAAGTLPVEDALTIPTTNAYLDKRGIPLTSEARGEIERDMHAKASLSDSAGPEETTATVLAGQVRIAGSFGAEGTPTGSAGSMLHRFNGVFLAAPVLMAPFADDASLTYSFVKGLAE